MNTPHDESLRLLQLREKLFRLKERNEPRELIEIVQKQLNQQIKLDAEKQQKDNEEKVNTKSPRSNVNTVSEYDLKTLIKLNAITLKIVQDFGALDIKELGLLLDKIRDCYQAMTEPSTR